MEAMLCLEEEGSWTMGGVGCGLWVVGDGIGAMLYGEAQSVRKRERERERESWGKNCRRV